MTSSRKTLCGVYVAIALVALIGTWRQNLAFMADKSAASGFGEFWLALLVNRATVSITVDIFMFGLAAFVWMVLEARRLGMRFVWLYFVFSMLIAVSVAYPEFLFMRERRLAELARADTEPAPSTSDTIGMSLLGLTFVGFTVWCTLR
jgi:hypothetical protein